MPCFLCMNFFHKFVRSKNTLAQLHALSDFELFDLVRSGDNAAFTVIYERYSALLYTFAHKLTADPDIAKDLVQELFISLWDKRAQTELQSSLASYLYTGIRYKFLKLVAHQKVRTSYTERFIGLIEQGSCTTDQYITDKELAAEVEKLISSLPAKQARIFSLSRMEDRSHQEIAEEMNLSEKTVKNLMSEAAKNLRLKIGIFLVLALAFLLSCHFHEMMRHFLQ